VSDTLAEPTFEPGERWIPVDKRWFGMDRRTILPAAIVMAVVVVMTLVLPGVRDAMRYDDEVVGGDVMGLDLGVTFVPEPGWGITSGVRTRTPLAGGAYPPDATVVDGSAALHVQSDTFAGDANALLDQFEKISGLEPTSDRVTITNVNGDTGVLEEASGATRQTLVVAYVFDGIGVLAVASAPADPGSAETDAMSRMITSIHADGGTK
jgi:hypothetical protein